MMKGMMKRMMIDEEHLIRMMIDEKENAGMNDYR
jgi:hypothetical protein